MAWLFIALRVGLLACDLYMVRKMYLDKQWAICGLFAMLMVDQIVKVLILVAPLAT